MLSIITAMMSMIPKKLRDTMRAPMLGKERLAFGRGHPSIKMNLTNLLVCAQNCGTCPSNPHIKGEALFCASGKSSATVQENGCNCVSCELSKLCSPDNTVYFCINGACAARDERSALTKFSDLAASYLQRFLFQEDGSSETSEFETDYSDLEDSFNEPDTPVTEVKLKFSGDKEVASQSDTPILQASLDAGIPHTHVCGGRARCSTCRVIVTGGIESCRPRNKRETRLALMKGFPPEVRLACQTTVTDDITLRRLVLDEKDISEAIGQGRADASEVGREVEATILFSDIRSFTSFSENALPYDIIHILNRYFETIGNIIDQNGGYIDKYMGDGIMAIFGLDKDSNENHAFLAASVALQIQQVLTDFNEYLQNHFNHSFRIGIGLHSGTVIVGKLGFHKKKEFTAVGDTVNTASRIESLNKRAGTSVLVSESTYARIKKDFSWNRKFTAQVKGKEEKVSVYEMKVL
ncbi:MAG: adenylate/guanylate cyclase domain-containing protein [Spirochaetia bacterium]